MNQIIQIPGVTGGFLLLLLCLIACPQTWSQASQLEAICSLGAYYHTFLLSQDPKQILMCKYLYLKRSGKNYVQMFLLHVTRDEAHTKQK